MKNTKPLLKLFTAGLSLFVLSGIGITYTLNHMLFDHAWLSQTIIVFLAMIIGAIFGQGVHISAQQKNWQWMIIFIICLGLLAIGLIWLFVLINLTSALKGLNLNFVF